MFAASANLQAAAPLPPGEQAPVNSPGGLSDPSLNDRPQSGCSADPPRGRAPDIPGEERPISDTAVGNLSTGGQQNTCRRNSLDGKLADLDLDDVPLESLLNQLVDRDCQSRGSSNDRDEKSD